MDIANSIWYQTGVTPTSAFTDAGHTYFDATMEGVNFGNASATLASINGWANSQTKGKIPSILDAIDPGTVMYLINAIYFKGSWRSQFNPGNTQPQPFTNSEGVVQQAQLMGQLGDITYGGTDAGGIVVDLPYGNTAFSMTAVLPPASMTLDAFVSSLSDSLWQTMLASLQTRDNAELLFPKLTLLYQRDLRPELTALGMGIAFGGGADFSAMTPGGGLQLSRVQQSAYVDIDEEGTEAAAATATGAVSVSGPAIQYLRFDHPYLFVIRERLTGTILFLGKVNRMP